MLINYSPSSGVDKSDKNTNTTVVKSADSGTPNGTRFQTFSEVGRDMETQLGKAVTFEVNRGSVKLLQNSPALNLGDGRQLI